VFHPWLNVIRHPNHFLFMGGGKVRKEHGTFREQRVHAKGTGFFDARFFRRAGGHGSTAGETPAATGF
jgi:hypothetical protein